MGDLVEQYLQYARRYAAVEFELFPGLAAEKPSVAALGQRLKGSVPVLLSEHGTSVDTSWFVQKIRHVRTVGQDLVFLIGGADGYPRELEPLCSEKIALTPLTLPHELALVILAEQIWRGVSVEAGHPYHK